MMDNFGAFVDDDDEMLVMPDSSPFIPLDQTYRVGDNLVPMWVMEGIAAMKIVFHHGSCDVLIKGRFIRAHAGVMIAAVAEGYTMFETEIPQ